jgi:hypothetical protein
LRYFSGFGFHRRRGKTHLAPAGSIEGLHLCVTGCPQKSTWSLEWSYRLHIISVFLDVVRWSQLIIYLSHVGLLVLSEHTSLRDHFIQFTFSAGGSRARRSFLQLIWLASVWVVWTERNHRLFRGSANTTHQLLDKIKLFSFRWLKATSVTLASNCHSWWSSLLPWLGIALFSFLSFCDPL